MKLYLLFPLLVVSLFLINCGKEETNPGKDSAGDGNNSPITGINTVSPKREAFLKECNSLDRFKSCVDNTVNRLNDVSKEYIAFQYGYCESLHIKKIDDLKKKYGIEEVLSPEESRKKDENLLEAISKCNDDMSNQELKTCLSNSVTVLFHQACQTAGQKL